LVGVSDCTEFIELGGVAPVKYAAAARCSNPSNRAIMP
jgi:hypothetical protein